MRPRLPDATGPKRRRMTSSADSCRFPSAEKATLYSFLSPKVRLYTRPRLSAQRPGGYPSGIGRKRVKPRNTAADDKQLDK